MDITMVTQLISSVGFPIAICIYSIYTLNKQEEIHKAEADKLADTHKAEIDELRKTIDNNTQAITALVNKL